MKSGAMLFLLAVAVSQVDLNLSEGMPPSGEADINTCPIKFYGKQFTKVEVFFHTDSSFALCFKNLPEESAKECLLLGNHGGATAFRLSENQNETAPGSGLHAALSTITSTSTCNVQISLQHEGVTYIEIRLYDFGRRTAMEVKTSTAFTPETVDVSTEIDSASIDSWTLGSSVAQSGVYEDISGCRQGDVFIPSAATVRNPDSCSLTLCNSEMEVWVVEHCQAPTVCVGNDICIEPTPVCTVTGTTVVDFFNRVHSVPDRCVYHLTGTDVKLFAGFRERQLKGVLFLDHLIIYVEAEGAHIYLEQGGRVLINDRILTLNATAQLLHGVELSKDQTGVTANITSSNLIVHFDGNTGSVTGPNEPLNGLCGDPSDESRTPSLIGSVFSDLSTDGCEIQSGGGGGAVNCSSSTDFCDLLSKAPFAVCHDHIDPAPYIAACKTACTPIGDLPCGYMETYAKACFLRVGIALEDWRTNAGCSASPQACLDYFCSDHEFCGEKLGKPRCFCRSDFASKYRSTDTLGEPTVCIESSARVTLAECLLSDKGIDYSTLHLIDPACTGQMDDLNHMVTFGFKGDACGTKITTNDSHVVYKNKIMTRESSSIITHKSQVVIDFACSFKQPATRSVSIKVKDSSVFEHIDNGVFNYTLTMAAYTDAGLTQRVQDDTDIPLNQRIWLELKMEGLSDDLVVLVTESCWSTDQPAENGGQVYDLVIGGCPNPADQTVEVVGNGLGSSNSYSFLMFEYAGGNSEIYLHCKLRLCPKGPGCVPDCSGGSRRRKRRSTNFGHAKGVQPIMTMVWKK